jgi:hypothetical protein
MAVDPLNAGHHWRKSVTPASAAPAKEFLRHAAECRRMARATRDRGSKATWNRLADRWQVCAELAERMNPPAPRGPASAEKHGKLRRPHAA